MERILLKCSGKGSDSCGHEYYLDASLEKKKSKPCPNCGKINNERNAKVEMKVSPGFVFIVGDQKVLYEYTLSEGDNSFGQKKDNPSNVASNLFTLDDKKISSYHFEINCLKVRDKMQSILSDPHSQFRTHFEKDDELILMRKEDAIYLYNKAKFKFHKNSNFWVYFLRGYKSIDEARKELN